MFALFVLEMNFYWAPENFYCITVFDGLVILEKSISACDNDLPFEKAAWNIREDGGFTQSVIRC